MAFMIVLALCVASAFAADPYQPRHGYKESYPDTTPYYNYNYEVVDSYSGNYFGQQEQRDGYNTQGSYHVLLPDGRTQTVKYTADEYGYNADVSYDGYAKEYKAAPSYHQPSYKAAPAYAPAPYRPAPAYAPAPVYKAAPSYQAPRYVAAPSYQAPSYGYQRH